MARRLAIFLGMCSVLLAASASAAPLDVQVLNLDGAPLRLAPVAIPAAAKTAGRPSSYTFNVGFDLQNTSPAPLERVVVEVVVTSPSGVVRKSHGFTIPGVLAPGVRSFHLYATKDFSASAGDRLVVVPVSAVVGGSRWTVDPETLARLHRTLDRMHGDLSEVERVWAAESTPQEPGLDPPRSGCTSDCLQLQNVCDTRCAKCASSSFSCNCSAESISYTCSCSTCPTSSG